MSDIKIEYGPASQPITITLAGLANGSTRECTAIDNGTNKFLDVLVYLRITLQTGTPASEKSIKVFVYGSEDGANYTNNATGSNAALTLVNPTNLLGPFLIYTPTGNVAYNAVFSIAQFFGGVLPPKWGIVIQNASGVSFSVTETDHSKEYRGLYQTVV